MKTLYAVTHINRDGMRQLTYRNTGTNHSPTYKEAQSLLTAIITNNTEKCLSNHFGKQAIGTFEVRPVECYDHGDAVRIFFD